jgi:hypothetical protein
VVGRACRGQRPRVVAGLPQYVQGLAGLWGTFECDFECCVGGCACGFDLEAGAVEESDDEGVDEVGLNYRIRHLCHSRRLDAPLLTVPA